MHLRSNLVLQFALGGLAVTIVSAIVVSAYVATELGATIDLLTAHGAAMRAGVISPDEAFSIPSLRSRVAGIRTTTFAVVGAALSLSYLSLVVIVWRGWGTIRRQQTELGELARTDPLTGVRNRRAFAEDVESELARRTRGGTLALVMIDIDDFKSVNDRFGHHTGDAALRALVSWLGEQLRTSDRLYRLGGDEFAVLLSDSDPRGLCDRLDDLVYVKADDEIVSLALSFGAAEAESESDTLDALLREADRAMYLMKWFGRSPPTARSDHGMDRSTELKAS